MPRPVERKIGPADPLQPGRPDPRSLRILSAHGPSPASTPEIRERFGDESVDDVSLLQQELDCALPDPG
jgi:hypothetical protein